MPKTEFNDLSNHFQVPLCETCFQVPVEFLMACACPCLYAFKQRLDIYDGDLSDARCCGGAYFPCRCGEDKCPYLCLCIEVWCCCWCAIFGNRFLIQSMYQVRNTLFEVAVIWCMCICSIISCIMSICFPDVISWWMECLCDATYCAFSACMQSQQQAELNFQRGK